MREGWEKTKVKKIANINQESINNLYPFEEIVYLDISSVGSGEASFENVLKTEKAPSRAKRIARRNDTIISTVRPGNKTYYYLNDFPENTVISTGFAVVHANKNKVDARFLYYALTNDSYIDYLVSVEKGANYPAISPNDILDSEINLPPLKTQCQIASILSAYDDLIENNLKRIKLLEEQAQQTYEEWFVRFKFPGHETAEFDEESGLPVGWEKVKLNEVLKFNQGVQVAIADQHIEYNSNRIRFIRIVDVTQGNQEKRFIQRPKESQIVRRKDLFMVRYGAPQVVTNFEGAIANNFFKLNIIDKQRVCPKYVYSFLNRKEITDYLMGVSVSATMPAISFNSFGQIAMILPEQTLQLKFHNYVDSSFELILSLQTQNQLLKEARDILLPRLMMGVIDASAVLEWEKERGYQKIRLNMNNINNSKIKINENI